MSVTSYDKLYIGGQWVAPEGTGQIEVISPYTEQVIATVPDGTVGDINRAVAAARAAIQSSRLWIIGALATVSDQHQQPGKACGETHRLQY